MNEHKNIMPIVQVGEVSNLIFYLRGQKVMTDKDLADLYQVKTKVLNQAVKRNIERFPDDFIFQLNQMEKQELVTNCDRFKSLKHSTSLPYVFTQNGVAMLSSILNSKRSIQVNIQIMRAFTTLRETLSQHLNLKQKIEDLEYKYKKHDKQFEEVFQAINNLIEAPAPVSTTELIRKGEGQHIEFKSTLRINLHTMKPDREIEFSVLKTIAGFLNCEGGTLLIGLNDQGEIIGIKNDNFASKDKMMLHLTNLIKSNIGVQHHYFIRYSVEHLKSNEIFRIDVRKANVPAYLKQDKDNVFYIRTGASTAVLPTTEIHDYIQTRFHTKK